MLAVQLGQGATAEDAVTALKQHQAKMFWLQVVATTAVSLSALIASYRQLKLVRREFARKSAAKRK